MMIENTENYNDTIICIKSKIKNDGPKHYMVKNSSEEIEFLHNKVANNRILKENQMTILHFNECVELFKDGLRFSRVSEIIGFQTHTIRKFLKIATSNDGISLKKAKKVCRNCDQYMNYVNYIDFQLIAEHLMSYKSKRTRLHSKIIQNRWEDFINFWNEELRQYKTNKYNKNIKLSARDIVYKFASLYPNSKCPTISLVYKWLKVNAYNLNSNNEIKLVRKHNRRNNK